MSEDEYTQVGWGYIDQRGFLRLQQAEPSRAWAKKMKVYAKTAELPEGIYAER